MPHSQHYKENFDAVLDIPVVKELLKQNNKLIKRNKKLSKRNKILKNLIYSLPEFRNPCNSCSCNHNKQKSCRDNVVVKTEKKYTETGSQSEDNDIIILDTPAKEEIKYEILEIDNEEEAESEEAEEEEAESEEAEEEEAESEEAESEEAESEEADEEEAEEEAEEAESEEAEEEEAESEEAEEEEAESEEAEEEEAEEEAESEEAEEEEAESEEAEEEEAEEEEEEVFETTINGKEYYTVCLMNGFIYEIMPDEDIGDEVGKFVNGKAVFDK